MTKQDILDAHRVRLTEEPNLLIKAVADNEIEKVFVGIEHLRDYFNALLDEVKALEIKIDESNN